jgi:predicted unusual protein kinase regulating ubiquinone biosynthesis (AarF/ABC1/UbiB family)
MRRAMGTDRRRGRHHSTDRGDDRPSEQASTERATEICQATGERHGASRGPPDPDRSGGREWGVGMDKQRKRRLVTGAAALPTTRWRRAAASSALVARTAASTILANALAKATHDVAAREARLAAAADHAAAVMGDMKGLVMKIGQLISIIDIGSVPEESRHALAHLQASAPPMPFDLVEAVVTDELGTPLHELFAAFSPQPIAAASLGQVHRARPRSGQITEQDLVVKVQYPGVAEAVHADLANSAIMSALVRMTQWAMPGLATHVDTRALVEELCARVTEELDYRLEAANQTRFADLWAGEPRIDVPRVVPELSTQRILTAHYVDALRWPVALEQSQELRDRWGEAIALFAFGSLHRHHLFNADPHPGNYLFHGDGTVTFLDFGCVKEFDPRRVAVMCRLVEAAGHGSDDDLVCAVGDAGMLRSRDGVDEKLIVGCFRRAFEPRHAPQPYTYTREWAATGVKDLCDLGRHGRATAGNIDLPADLLFLMRITAGLNSVLAHLEATIDWDRLVPQVFGDENGPSSGSESPALRLGRSSNTES